MGKLYKIKYKIVDESGKQIAGIRTRDKPLAEYRDLLNKEYPDARMIYLELIEEYDEPETPESASAAGGLIIMPWMGDVYTDEEIEQIKRRRNKERKAFAGWWRDELDDAFYRALTDKEIWEEIDKARALVKKL